MIDRAIYTSETKTINDVSVTVATQSAAASATAENEISVQKNYVDMRDFSISGKWKNVGTYTFGQAQNGAVVIFDRKNCNLYSPQDTYAFYLNGDESWCLRYPCHLSC